MLGAGMLSLSLFLFLRVKKGGATAVAVKTLTSLFFMATGITALFVNPGNLTWGLLIIFGMIFGLVGDIVLDVRIVYPDDADAWQATGMFSFLIGHIIFLIAIFLTLPAMGDKLWMVIVFPALIALVAASGAVLGGPKMGLNYGKWKLVSFLYALIGMFMVFTSGAAAIASGFAVKWIVMFVGAFLFIGSDLVLSQQYFGPAEKLKNPVLVIVNHAAYYFAQFLIALTILF
jgi:hypothetical protein